MKAAGASFGTNLVTLMIVCSIQLAWTAATAQEEPVLNYEPGLVTENGSADCYDCHEHAVDAWKESTHYRTFDEMHLRDEAQAIIDRMGMSGSIKRSAECTQCHYTRVAADIGARAKTIAGVSCQRCHGPAKNWMDPHQNDEDIPSRVERLAKAIENGMRPTTSIYDLARNCFQCHTVPRETLVNDGEHPAGSEDFELVAWSQGEVLHNFLAPTDNPEMRIDSDTNHPATKDRQRLMYVMGKAIDLEFSLRSLALADGEGAFFDSMSDRVQTVHDELDDMALGIAEIDSMLAAVPKDGDGLKLATGNHDEYLSAADTISELAQTLESKVGEYSGALAKVDAALPTEFRGDRYE